jgi:glycerate kinase
MKIVIAPNAFKGSMTAFEAALAIERGIKRVFPAAKTVKLPVADGGDGTMEVLARATGGRIVARQVTGPLGRKVRARYAVLGGGMLRTAVIEMAEASGLKLIKKAERDPMRTTTRGVGELINDAVRRGCRKLIIGIGGSATNDGGSGMCLALGFKLVKKNGKPVGPGGKGLLELDRIENPRLAEKFKKLDIVTASDVTNLLLGRTGASRMFGPQKGAGPAMVGRLERGLERFAGIIKRDLKTEVRTLRGGGAAGGLGAGLYAFLGAKTASGVDLIVRASGMEKKIRSSDLVVTGEGAVDDQSLHGKGPVGIARLAKKHRVPVLFMVGRIGNITEKFYKSGIGGIMNTVKYPMTLEQAMKRGPGLLADAAERAARIIKLGMDMK